MEGWSLSDDGLDWTTLSNGGAGIPVLPGQRFVLGRDADPSRNGGVQVDFVYAGFTLSNTSDEIILRTPDGGLVDRVAYDGGIEWPDSVGSSIGLSIARQTAGQNDAGKHWCLSQSPLPGGDKGTPGARNDPCGP